MINWTQIKNYQNSATTEKKAKTGKVFITGFGPGDPELLTIKALKAIEAADIIYFDDLVGKDFLKPFLSEQVYVGKRKGKHSFSQEQINEFLYQSAKAGKNTVRLKGGDPFVFGRGGEELEYLKERFIDVEIIPGISAAFGAASSIGVPLTQRGVSSSVAFCTGFPKNLDKIPNADTLVFYMSATTIWETAVHLLKNGYETDTPVALIQNASLKNQKNIFTDLKEISEGKASLASPMIAIIGEVAREKVWHRSPDILLELPEYAENTKLAELV